MFDKPNGLSPERTATLRAAIDAAQAAYEADRRQENFWKLKNLRDELKSLNRRTDYRPLG